MSERIANEIKRRKLIAIIRGVKKEHIEDLADALLEGGVTLMEITFDHLEDNFIEKTSKKIELCRKRFEGRLTVGAGTVLNGAEVRAAVESGAEFIISPNIKREVIEATKELDKVSIPGALTPTEAVFAHECGADFVKLFPAGDLGPGYIKALASPLNHIPFLAVGGIDADNIASFLNAGAVGAGVGGSLIDKTALENSQLYKISDMARLYIKQIS